jgi:primary-amine oxidase
MTAATRHPLAPLDADEIRAARRIVFESGRAAIPAEDIRFAYVGLCDPPKALVHAYDRGEETVLDRRLRLVLLQGPEAEVVEAIVSVTRGTVDSWVEVPDARPALQMEEAICVLAALWDDPAWNAALDRRGIVDKSRV